MNQPRRQSAITFARLIGHQKMAMMKGRHIAFNGVHMDFVLNAPDGPIVVTSLPAPDHGELVERSEFVTAANDMLISIREYLGTGSDSAGHRLLREDLDFSIKRFVAAQALQSTEWRPSFQSRVQPWMMECFGPEIAADKEERNHRFLEEALELVQSCGCSASEAHQLVDYVYGRDVGEPFQESGGVMVTHAALCLANGLDMHADGETELARIWTKVEQIRAKQAGKPKHSPLPTPPQEQS